MRDECFWGWTSVMSAICVAFLFLPCVTLAQEESNPLPAQESPAREAAGTLPASQTDLFNARTVAVVAYGPKSRSAGGRILRGSLTGKVIYANAERAKKGAVKALQKWGRYSVVEDPSQADLVFVIAERDLTVPYREIEDRLDVVLGGREWDMNAKTPMFTVRSVHYTSKGGSLVIRDLRKAVEKQEKEKGR